MLFGILYGLGLFVFFLRRAFVFFLVLSMIIACILRTRMEGMDFIQF